jgi:hypothetical protein
MTDKSDAENNDSAAVRRGGDRLIKQIRIVQSVASCRQTMLEPEDREGDQRSDGRELLSDFRPLSSVLSP